MQNTSHAVMSQRHEPKGSLDDFPTPPWATRALLEHIFMDCSELAQMTALEPACGRGHMASVLHEYFETVIARDVHPYGYGEVQDFLAEEGGTDAAVDWVIANPPFKLAEQFAHRSLAIAKRGVAMLVRTSFLESRGRYERLFKPTPPAIVAPFAERVTMLAGRLNKKGSTATSYAWLVWLQGQEAVPRVDWVPPCRKSLERDEDYAPRVFPLVRDNPDGDGSYFMN